MHFVITANCQLGGCAVAGMCGQRCQKINKSFAIKAADSPSPSLLPVCSGGNAQSKQHNGGMISNFKLLLLSQLFFFFVIVRLFEEGERRGGNRTKNCLNGSKVPFPALAKERHNTDVEQKRKISVNTTALHGCFCGEASIGVNQERSAVTWLIN